MNIVIEGLDASGKSTLARYLSTTLCRPIVPSEGPEKFAGEIDERIKRYKFFENVIFDRHPCISQMIYSTFNDTTIPNPDLVFDFYETRPVMIYCTTQHRLTHRPKEHDSPEHLAMIEHNAQDLKRMYDQWAIDCAQFIYRPGIPMRELMTAVRGLVGVA